MIIFGDWLGVVIDFLDFDVWNLLGEFGKLLIYIFNHLHFASTA